MKELLLKIKALFEGSGVSDATKAVGGLDQAGDKASKGGLAGLQSVIDSASARAGIFGGAVSALGSQLISFAAGAVFAAVNAVQNLVAGFVAGIKGVADFADQLEEMAQKTGQTYDTVLTLQAAFKNVGLSGDAVAPAINKLQRALAGVNEDGTPTAGVFARLGLSIEQLKALDSATAMQAIGTAIRDLKDPTAQAAAVFDIFGRSGVNLMAILKDPTAFDTARQQVAGIAAALGVGVGELGKFSDAVKALDYKQIGFFAGVTKSFAGDLGKAAKAMNTMQWPTKLGLDIGYSLRAVLDMATGLKDANQALKDLTGQWVDLNKALEMTSPLAALKPALDAVKAGLRELRDIGKKSSDYAEAQAKTEAALAAAGASQQIAEVASAAQAATTAASQQGAAAVQTAGAEAAASVQLTAEQLKVATAQIASAISQANTDGVTPAMTALVVSVQDGFARVVNSVTSATTSINEQTAATGATLDGIAAQVASASQAVQGQGDAVAEAISSLGQAVTESNRALAAATTAAISGIYKELGNLQAQISKLASRG